MRSRVIERNMFNGASRNIFTKARELRKNMTSAEKKLWSVLKNRKEFKLKFRRQHPFDIFILDFYCHEIKLAIEVDGEIHLNKEILEHDDGREYEIEKFGINILRLTNKEVFEEIESVKNRILHEISSLSPIQGVGGKSPPLADFGALPKGVRSKTPFRG
jgi:very-short-patch-repair endonuclease